LDQAGYNHVDIFVSGGITPERIAEFREAEAPVSVFGVGYHIAAAQPNSFTGDIHEIEGRPMAKRGRIPGLTVNPRLTRVL
jgi:nicotinate phosphoribosyltransferase